MFNPKLRSMRIRKGKGKGEPDLTPNMAARQTRSGDCVYAPAAGSREFLLVGCTPTRNAADALRCFGLADDQVAVLIAKRRDYSAEFKMLESVGHLQKY